jgi:hypothetical protein
MRDAMRFIGYTMFGLGLGLLLLAGAALVFDLGALKPLYERVAGHYLQREVRVEGEMSVRFGRSVMASASDVKILGIDPEAVPLAQVEFVEVQLALPALFDKLVDIELVRIEGATLNLEIDDQGQGNWPTFEDGGPAQANRGDDPAQAEGTSDIALRVAEAHVTKSLINVHNSRSDLRRTLTIDRFDGLMSADTTEASGTGTLNERAFETTLTLDGVDSLLTIAKWDLDWRGQIGRAQFQATGHLEALDQLEQSQLALTLHTDSANELLDTLSLPVIDDGPVDINFRLSQQAATAHLDLDAVFGEFSIFGTALSEDPLTLSSAQLDLVATGPNLAHLGALGGQANWPETPFEIDLKTSREGRQVDVSTLRLISDVMDLELTGTVADFRSPGTGRLSGTVDIPSLSVWSSVLNLPSELSGPFTGTVSLTGEGTGADLVVSSQSDLFSLDIGGRLEPGESMLGSTMRLQGEIIRPGRFLSLFMEDAPALPPAAFEGQFAIENADTVLLSGLQVSMGGDAVTANGTVGWDAKKHETSVALSVTSPNLNETLLPWLAAPEMMPPLPVEITGVLAYPVSKQFVIQRGSISAQAGTGEFTGIVSVLGDSPSVSGNWRISAPALQPLLTQITVPEHFEKPVAFQGQASWQAGYVNINDGLLSYGPTDVTGDLLIDLGATKLKFDLQSTTPDLNHYAPENDIVAAAFSIPIALRASGEITEDLWSVEKFQLESTQAFVRGSGNLELDGDEFIDSHITSDIRIANLTAFNELFDLSLPDQDLQILVDMDSSAGALVVEQLDLRSGESDLSATGQATNPSEPEIVLNVDSDRLDLSPWLALLGDSQSDLENASDRLIPDVPLTYEVLTAFQADTTVSIRELNGLARPVVNVLTRIDLGREGIRVTSASAGNERGGVAKLTGTLIPNAEGVPELSMLLEGNELTIGIPKAPGEDVTALPPYDIRLKLDGAGQTTRELAASLNGYINMTMSQGIVLNAGLDRVTNSFLQELSRALDPLQEQEESTKINCAAAFSVLNDGKLHGKPAVVVDTPNVKMLADATANLASEKIKVQFKTVPQKGLGVSMSSIVNPYIEVTGTLAQPRLSLNPENTVVGGSLAVITGGISILVRNVLDRLSTSGNVCADRLRKANEEMAQMDA